ncbi:hypothetical protein F5Y18DRAFT_429078 [Xylariaceae sp. FL1019]|nr:hypothetical protein F5Y18DRAFT_429078 [Xylariaceae sp. FL1019]
MPLAVGPLIGFEEFVKGKGAGELELDTFELACEVGDVEPVVSEVEIAEGPVEMNELLPVGPPEDSELTFVIGNGVTWLLLSELETLLADSKLNVVVTLPSDREVFAGPTVVEDELVKEKREVMLAVRIDVFVKDKGVTRLEPGKLERLINTEPEVKVGTVADVAPLEFSSELLVNPMVELVVGELIASLNEPLVATIVLNEELGKGYGVVWLTLATDKVSEIRLRPEVDETPPMIELFPELDVGTDEFVIGNGVG